MAYPITAPYSQFVDRNGDPLENGYIYIGTANLDAQTNPITVYWDAAGTLVAQQPIRTSGGYPVWNGTAANIYVTADTFSTKVLDKNGTLIYSKPTYDGSGSSQNVGFTQSGTGAVPRTVQSKLRETVSVLDFGAKGDGVTDDTVAIQAAITYAVTLNANTVYFPAGQYKINNPGIQVPTGIRLVGTGSQPVGGGSQLIAASASVTRIVSINGTDCGLEGFYILGEATRAVIGVDIGAFTATYGTPGRIYIKNVVSRLCSYGFHCINGPFLVHWESCVGWNCKKGWYFDATGASLARGINIGALTNCHGVSNTEHGCYAVVCNALTIDNCGFDSEVIGIQGSLVQGLAIRNCTMDYPSSIGILVGGCTFNIYACIFASAQLPMTFQTVTNVSKGTVTHCVSTGTVGTYSATPDVSQQIVFDANSFDKAIQNDGQRFGHADRIESGSGTVSAGGSVGQLTASVTFSRAFSSLRTVQVTPVAQYTNRMNYQLASVTTSGFQVIFTRDDGGTWSAGNTQDFYWSAIGVN